MRTSGTGAGKTIQWKTPEGQRRGIFLRELDGRTTLLGWVMRARCIADRPGTLELELDNGNVLKFVNLSEELLLVPTDEPSLPLPPPASEPEPESWELDAEEPTGVHALDGAVERQQALERSREEPTRPELPWRPARRRELDDDEDRTDPVCVDTMLMWGERN